MSDLSFNATTVKPATLAGDDIVVPIGTILPWHKSLAGVPSLSARFVECNGQVLSDADSPLNGQTIPDLNGLGHFMRGSATSGTVQAQATLAHAHDIGHNHTQNSHGHTQNSHSHPDASWGYDGTATSGVIRRALFDFNVDDAGTPDVDYQSSATATNQSTTATNIAHVGNSGSSSGAETRPVNMSVVFIMRVK
jgi:hypothetical protein